MSEEGFPKSETTPWYKVVPHLYFKSRDLRIDRMEVDDGRILVNLTQDDEPACPDRVPGIEDLQHLFPYDGSGIALLTVDDFNLLVARLKAL